LNLRERQQALSIKEELITNKRYIIVNIWPDYTNLNKSLAHQKAISGDRMPGRNTLASKEQTDIEAGRVLVFRIC
jgi:hypothetical protein